MKKKFFSIFILFLFSFMTAGVSCSNTCRLSKTDSKTYYVITMADSKLIFAKIAGKDKNYLYLTDVFYLQRTPPLADKTDPPQKSGFQLVPQTGDIYAPENAATVNRDHVFSYQKLRDDSPILKGIERTKQQMEAAKKEGIPPQAPSTTPAPAPTPLPAPVQP